MVNKDTFHRHSLRLKEYDYAQPGAYFITICTYQRKWLFAEIHDGVMKLSAFGRVVSAQWLQLGAKHP
jgi:hypothetical protein